MPQPRIYGSKWNKPRLRFLQQHPLCVMCHQQGRVTGATVVDHIVPHKLKAALNSGDKAQIALAQKLFWDTKNWQPLCETHHNATKQRMEKSGRGTGCDMNGMPLDPNSHWNH
ncbi:HNH endonuclease signature motif containing protein [Xenorhabdus sp. XENO-10]|uniref:HNH endonuclease signature motif containing protein n=2 Tax=Xenorhabdus yunnanensis TaxID=3025878 RepID=A0ABT5LKI3_9GAMM|nr:HNH endonuclease signature motif containing protein [Xenorhabdus yunnanensis]MDC9591078.1 HNH endonuclease signature motif containing protein [Xenorhabdus yunnanensis]